MPDTLLLGAAVFAGAVVSGLAGFAFSAAAGAILVHVLSPQEAVPLMMACSIAVQAGSLVSLRRSMRWRESLRYILGGALGLAPALYLLVHVDAVRFRTGFGLFLAFYSAYMLVRPRVQLLRAAETRAYDGFVGFAGGLIGGLTAMPGAAPIVWCDLHGFAKEQQRGVVQPFIAAMQLVSMAMLLGTGHISSRLALEFTMVLPALAVGTSLGIYLFGRVDDMTFRRIVLVALFVSGTSFILHR